MPTDYIEVFGKYLENIEENKYFTKDERGSAERARNYSRDWKDELTYKEGRGDAKEKEWCARSVQARKVEIYSFARSGIRS